MAIENRSEQETGPRVIRLEFQGEGMWNFTAASGRQYRVSDGDHNRTVDVDESDVPSLLEQGKFKVVTEGYKAPARAHAVEATPKEEARDAKAKS